MRSSFRGSLIVVTFALFFVSVARAQFRDDFDTLLRAADDRGSGGWSYFTGDGEAKMELLHRDGVLKARVDARQDRRGIWWALLKRRVSEQIDTLKLSQRGTELRIEARVRTNTAPRRINLHANTQRTIDFHSHLREFELAEPNTWYTVSFTTTDFPAQPGDSVFAQLALMDWGTGVYELEVDYYKVDVVTERTADLGEPLEYHPAIPPATAFAQRVVAAADATLDRREPDANLEDFSAIEDGGPKRLLAVGGSTLAVVRFDFGQLADSRVSGSGLLELTTHSVHRRAQRTKDFGLVRIVELIGGAQDWSDDQITFTALLAGKAEDSVINGQMIIDLEVHDTRGAKTYFTLPRPVLQRLVDGKARGLAIVPLGSIHAAFFASEEGPSTAPAILLNTAARSSQ
jgi:hypothetical protein